MPCSPPPLSGVRCAALGLARFGAATDERLESAEGWRTHAWPPVLASPNKKNPGKGKGKGKAGTVATVATVDQFIRHAESGFFGDDEEADCPFVWDGDC